MNLQRIFEKFFHPNRFDYAVTIVLEHEGGYSDDKNDPGGETNFGISQKFLNEQKLNYVVKDISIELAKSIYKKYWWDKYQYNNLKSLKIATKVFDCSVDCGPHESTIILQRAINDISDEKLTVDGLLGDRTFYLSNKCNDSHLLDNIRFEMKRFYLNLINERPELYSFKTGWLLRSES